MMTIFVDPSLEEALGLDGLRAEFFDFSDRSRCGIRLDEVRSQIANGRFVWIDVDSAEADAKTIIGALPEDVDRGVHIGAILAVHLNVNVEHVSSLHRAESLLHMVLVSAASHETTRISQRLDVVIREGLLLTIHRGPHEVISAVRRDYVSDFQQHATTPSFLIYEICNQQVEQFLVAEGQLEKEVEATRLALRQAADDKIFNRLAEISDSLLALRKLIVPVRRVLEELVSRKTTLISEASLGFLGVIIGTLERLLDDIASNREILESSLQFSITVMSHRTSQTMNRLAVVSTIFLPLTFLCGVYGMNFDVMPETRWAHGYTFFWILSGVVTLTLLFLLRRSRLL